MIYGFENCVLDAGRRELRRGGELISVEPQVFDLILFLLVQRDRVISKEDLIAGVWNGRIVSDSALSSRVTAARQAIGDNGDEQRLIRTIPRRGVRFVAEVRENTGREQALVSSIDVSRPKLATPVQPVELPLPDKPSLVVLPFANLSNDPSQDYFADGMVEDITVALGRLSWLFVIGSGSAFTYKNVAVDTRQVGAELGVRYVLRGSVRRDSSRVRVTVQLADSGNGIQVWADRFDEEIDNIFELQDRVAAHVSATIAPALRVVEAKRTERKPTENLTAYDLLLRASRHQRESLEQNRQALRMLYRAIELDPSYGAAYGLAAFCHFWQKVLGWVAPADPGLREGAQLAVLAVEHGGNDSEALWMAAQSAAMLGGEVLQSVDWIEKSLMLNPNSPSAWWSSCLVRAFRGDTATALDHADRAKRLDPRDPMAGTHLTAAGLAHFFAGQYDKAARVADEVLQREPSFPPALRLKAATCGALGRIEEGQASVERLRAVRPDTVTSIRAYYAAPLAQNPAGLERYLDGLRACGLSEN